MRVWRARAEYTSCRSLGWLAVLRVWSRGLNGGLKVGKYAAVQV